MISKVLICKLIIITLANQCCSGSLGASSNTESSVGKFSDELKHLDVLEPGKVAIREVKESSAHTDQNKRSIQLVKQAVKEIRAQ